MVGERTVPAIAQTIVQGEARSPFERVVRVEGQTVIDGAPVGEAECRLLAEKTQAVAEHDLVLRVIKRVGVAAGSERIRVGKRPGCTVAASGDTRCQTEERSEYKLFDVVVLDAEAECVASEDGCAVIFGLFVVLEGPLGREEVRTNDHVVADANEDWLTAGINSSGSAGGGVRVHNEVVEVHIGEAYGMRPPAGGGQPYASSDPESTRLKSPHTQKSYGVLFFFIKRCAPHASLLFPPTRLFSVLPNRGLCGGGGEGGRFHRGKKGWGGAGGRRAPQK